MTIDGGATYTAPRPVVGAMRFCDDLLLVGTERLDLGAGRFEVLADPRPAVVELADDLEVIAAAWDAAGDQLVVSARSPRGQRPQAWLTLMRGCARQPIRALWSGPGEAPRTVAFEGGTIAAEIGARAWLWRGEQEIAPPAGPVSGLALGDAGELLVLTDHEGGVTVWRGPGFEAGERVGRGRAPAAAADAPVVAWATPDAAVVWRDGSTETLPLPSAVALALDAAGTWLVALDDEDAASRERIA